MNYKTKAQELSFLSRDYAVAKDKRTGLRCLIKMRLCRTQLAKAH